jgi:hypothetical protein
MDSNKQKSEADANILLSQLNLDYENFEKIIANERLFDEYDEYAFPPDWEIAKTHGVVG